MLSGSEPPMESFEKAEIRSASPLDALPQLGNNTLAFAAEAERSHRGLSAIPAYWRPFLWCMFCCLGALLWGYDVQVSSGLLSVPQFRRDFGRGFQEGYVVTASWQSAFNSSASIGGMFGGLASGWLADHTGRRGASAVACIVSISGVLIQVLCPAHNNALLLVGKLINGFAMGIYIAAASAYCAELSPVPLRGITTGSVNLWIVIGQFLANCMIQGVGSRSDKYAYRIPFAVQWVFPVVLLIGLPFAPESPWYLLRKGQEASATAVLTRLGSKDVNLQLKQINDTIELENFYAASSTYAECFKGNNFRRTIIAMMVFFFQQIAGVIFVLGFGTYFFQLAGFQISNSFKLGVGVSAVGVVGNLTALYSVNRFGRRSLFLFGMVGCALVNLALGVAALPSTPAARWAQAGMTLVFGLVYQASIGPLGYVIFSEVGSDKLRSKTVGLGICVNALFGMVANIGIPYMVNPDQANLGGKVGFIFGGLSTLGSVWTWLYIPETRNRTIDELDQLFEAKVSARRFQHTSIDSL